jgi:ADP-heptose:LPS heptosyltransferase
MEKKKIMYNRILLTRMKYIGDVVLTTPIIRTLREAFPKAGHFKMKKI